MKYAPAEFNIGLVTVPSWRLGNPMGYPLQFSFNGYARLARLNQPGKLWHFLSACAVLPPERQMKFSEVETRLPTNDELDALFWWIVASANKYDWTQVKRLLVTKKFDVRMCAKLANTMTEYPPRAWQDWQDNFTGGDV